MSEQPRKNHGKQIGDIVRSALQSGDLSRMSELGPAIEEAVRDNVPGAWAQPGTRPPAAARGGQAHPYQGEGARPVWQGRNGAVPARGVRAAVPGGVVRMVLGIVGMVTFGLCAAAFAALGAAMPWLGVFVPLSMAGGVAFACCGALLGSGIAANRLKKRVAGLYALLEKKPVMVLEELAHEMGRTPRQILKDYKKARMKGWLQDVRTDAGETCLIRGEAAWQQYADSEKSRAQRERDEAERQRRLADPSLAGMEAFRSEGAETLRKIREANDAIPGEEVSRKLSRLEVTTERIFAYVEGHPEKLPETRKLMSYYLPTTLKLVQKYRQYEEMDFQPDNVVQAKADIERALDTIDEAFNNFLSGLFQDDTLDVVTDAAVLQQMLEQEGLVGKHFEIGKDGGEMPPCP